MSEFYQFAGEHPVLMFFLAYLAHELCIYPLRLVNRWIRHRNIVAQGWPPVHVDADGDAVKHEEQA